MAFVHTGGSDCACDNCYRGGDKSKKPNFQSRSNKNRQSRQQSAERSQQRDRSDRTSPHNDGIKSNRNPRRR